jgi:ABC-2 type transport system permease protein
MLKVWRIALYHFSQEARKRTFILVLFALPLFMAFATGFGYLASRLERDQTTLGYVDPAGWLADPDAGPRDPDVTLMPFAARADAHQALEAGEIDAYFLLPTSVHSRMAQLLYFEPPRYAAIRCFEDLVRRNRMAGRPAPLIERTIAGADVTVRATESNREFPGGNPTLSHFVPLMASAIFSFLVVTTFGYLGEAVVTEKENRTMEVVMTSVSAGRLMAGKIAGGLGIALLQLLVWVACLVLVVAIGGTVLEIEWLRNIDPDWRDVAMIVVVALPAYLFLAALTTALGATLVETQEIQQLGGLAFIVFFLPLYLLIPLSQVPNGPLALAFSFFPLTSVPTLAVRSLIMEIPTWQIAVAAVIALVSGLLMVWLAGKAFRVSMLRYGQRIRWRELLPRRPAGTPRSARSVAEGP